MVTKTLPVRKALLIVAQVRCDGEPVGTNGLVPPMFWFAVLNRL